MWGHLDSFVINDCDSIIFSVIWIKWQWSEWLAGSFSRAWRYKLWLVLDRFWVTDTSAKNIIRLIMTHNESQEKNRPVEQSQCRKAEASLIQANPTAWRGTWTWTWSWGIASVSEPTPSSDQEVSPDDCDNTTTNHRRKTGEMVDVCRGLPIHGVIPRKTNWQHLWMLTLPSMTWWIKITRTGRLWRPLWTNGPRCCKRSFIWWFV